MELRRNHQFDPFSEEAAALPGLDLSDIDHDDPLAYLKAMGAGTHGGLPLPKIASPAEVRSEAFRRATSIFTNWDTLGAILDRHEAIIQKRWKKKRQEQRRQILLTAWGGSMASTHRPDFDAFRRENESQREAGTQFREAFMWPYINQEDLVQPKTLLLLLNARGRHSPAAFAASDFEAMHLGCVTKAIVPVFLNLHTMLLRTGTDPHSYGRLLSWDDHPDAFDWCISRKEHQPGEGLLILEAQDRVLTFLVSCAKQLLADIPSDQLQTGALQPEPQSVSSTAGGPMSLPDLALEAPYRVPAKLDIDALALLLAVKRDEAKDHFWSLREDPGYFHDVLRDVAEHRQEQIKDTQGQTHPVFRKHREDVFWGRVIGNEVATAYLQLEMWSELHRQAARLGRMQSELSGKIKPEDDLPAEYLHSILEFRYWLNQAAKGPMNLLKVAVVASPPWRPYFERTPVSDPTAVELRVQQKTNVKFDREKQNLSWLLRTLWDDGRPLFLLGITNVLDELQRAVDVSTDARSMLTSYVAGLIADLSVVCECLRQINLYQPWANTFENALVDAQDKIMKDFAKRTSPWSHFITSPRDETQKLFARFGAPNEVNFRYPIDKRRTKENIEAMRLAEANLDRFWRAVDEMIRQKAGDLRGTAVKALLTEPRALRRTPQWFEPSEMKISKSKGLETDDLPLKPLSELYLDLQQRTEGTVAKSNINQIPASRAKEKTRGKADGANFRREQQVPEASPVDVQPVFKVDGRALKVFKTLFFAQSPTALPGEIPWIDFLHATSSTGFHSKKLHGSAWQFTPTKLDMERGIQFHEPHPAGKIPYLVARRHGRRLNRAYGWHAGMFELAGPKDRTEVQPAILRSSSPS